MTQKTVMDPAQFEGAYIATDAALFLTATLKRDIPADVQVEPVNARNIVYWIRAGLTLPQLRAVPGRELLMGFEDLISMRVISLLRALGVTWPKIHLGEDFLRQETQYPRPFAVKQIWTERVDIFAESRAGLVAASHHGQLAFLELISQYLQPVGDLTFRRKDSVEVAATWTPHEDVLLNPQVQFGRPCVAGKRIPTRTLWQMWMGGDSISYLAHSFGITEAHVEHALEWEDRLRAAKGSQISRR